MDNRVAGLPSLSFGRMAVFAFNDYGFNLYWQSVSLFLLFYYTDALGLSAAVAGLIYMIASIFDGAIDPVMGAVGDRTRTRWGRYRPYLLFGAVPLGLSFALLYYRPPFSGALLVAFVLVAHLLFRVCYTAVSIPATSLNARLTVSSSERSTLAGLRIIFATLAGFTVASTTQPLAARFGGSDHAFGFFIVAVLFAVVATCIFPAIFFIIREPKDTGEAPPAFAISDYWRAIRANRAFLALVIGIMASVVCSTALGKSVLYYFKYYLHDEASSRLALSLSAAAGLVIVPFWVLVTRFVGKRMVWLIASAWGMAGLLFFALVDIRSSTEMIAFLIYMQICSIALAFTFWSMLPDTVEYGEWCTHIRAESFIFGLGQFCLKAALGIGAGAFGVALSLVGYVPNTEQTTHTLHGMKIIMVAFPAVGLVAGAAAIFFYPIRRGTHETIVAQLARRRAAPSEVVAAETAA